MYDGVKKYTLDYGYLRDMKKFESKMNDGEFDSFGQHRKQRENGNSNNFWSDFLALLRSV